MKPFLISAIVCTIIMSSCTSSCAPTYEAGVRRVAESRLKLCLQNAGNNPAARIACREESYKFCNEQFAGTGHTEPGCGLGWDR